MASLTWWTWVWASSGSWWWTGRPSVLLRIGHDWVTKLTDHFKTSPILTSFHMQVHSDDINCLLAYDQDVKRWKGCTFSKKKDNLARSQLLKPHQKADDGTTHSPKSKERWACPAKCRTWACVYVGRVLEGIHAGRKHSAGVLDGSLSPTVEQQGWTEPLAAQMDQRHMGAFPRTSPCARVSHDH